MLPKLLVIASLMLIGSLFLAGCGGCNSSTPTPPPPPPPQPSTNFTFVDETTYDKPITDEKDYNRCDLDTDSTETYSSKNSVELSEQSELVWTAGASGELSLSPAMKASLQTAVQSHYANQRKLAQEYEAGTTFTVKGRHHNKYIFKWRDTRQTGTVQYMDQGESKTAPFDYRIGLQYLGYDTAEIPCPGAPPAEVPTQEFVSQASYTDCANRPTGSVCAQYSDGYIWLVYDSIMGWADGGSWNGQKVQVAQGSRADYHHVLGTLLVKEVPKR